MGVFAVNRKRDGKLVYYERGSSKNALKAILGHLINPQICGLGFNEAADMTLAEAEFAISAVQLSNQMLEKAAQKNG